MLKIYGTMLCKDCVDCAAAFDAAGLPYEFCAFDDNLAHLKQFLLFRDSSPFFDAVREAGTIGIPCIVKDDGTLTLDWASCLPL